LHSVPFPFPKLIDKAETNDATYAFVVLDRELYAIAVAAVARAGSYCVALSNVPRRRRFRA